LNQTTTQGSQGQSLSRRMLKVEVCLSRMFWKTNDFWCTGFLISNSFKLFGNYAMRSVRFNRYYCPISGHFTGQSSRTWMQSLQISFRELVWKSEKKCDCS